MKLPQYIVEDAARIVLDNISNTLQHKLTLEDLEMILEIEFEFLEQVGAISNTDPIIQLPIEIDDSALEYYVINQCAKENIYLTFEEVNEILKAELIYLDALDLIDEEGLTPFYN